MTTEEPEDQEPEFPPLEDVDHVLQVIVWGVNKTLTDRIGVTLYVGGSIVSGDLISRKAFFDGVAGVVDEAVARDADTDEEAAFARMFRDLGDHIEEAPDLGSHRVAFIHLANARAFAAAGGPIPTNQGVYWRGRLAAVDGWNLGSLGVAPSQLKSA